MRKSSTTNIKHRDYSNKDQRNNGLQIVKEGLEESAMVPDTKEIEKQST